MCVSYTPAAEESTRGVLDNNFDIQDGDQVFFLAPGEQIEIVAQNDSDDDEDSDYEDSEEDNEDDSEDDDEVDEVEERHQFYRQQALEWQEHQELEEAKANELFEDEWRYREMFEDELRRSQLTQEQQINNDDEIPPLVTDDSDTDVLSDNEQENVVPLPPNPPVLRRETASDYLTPVRMTEVNTPTAPRARRVLGDLSNVTIRPRRLRFN